MPDDVQILHHALTTLHNPTQSYTTLHLSNCGTAMRFLTAYCAQLDGQTTILDGVERMRHRPIGQLVDALREIGAQIEYLGEEGFPPLRITGCALDKHRVVRIDNPLSTQFVSALLLIGANVQTTSTSPYINITREIIDQYSHKFKKHNSKFIIEKDWSSAAFWYEYVALHGGEIELPGLYRDSLQGDKVVADIFSRLGIQTQYTSKGVTIFSTGVADLQGIVARSTAQRSAEEILHQDFSACPDLYPAVALTCERLGITLHATGTESLSIKESDRIRAVCEHRVEADHRMAMALLIAGYPVDNTDCIKKSYPQFIKQWSEIQRSKITFVIPRRGINDEGKGKKHALYRLISEAQTEYVWMQDDDVVFDRSENILSGISLGIKDADLAILPLRMKSTNIHPSLLERLQIAEYAAIQQLTIESAQKGKAVMCSGANLIVRRDRWLESYLDLHPELPSGDDMFLLESFKRRRLKITVLDDPQFEAIVRPHTSWRAFFRQRMRWAGKAPKYTDKDICRCGAIILLVNILQLLCPPVLLVKFPFEYHIIKKRDASVSLFTAFVLELCYPIYMLVSLVGGLFRRQW
jgi:5-enolpyruvylshikimate-3-phosphate synthase